MKNDHEAAERAVLSMTEDERRVAALAAVDRVVARLRLDEGSRAAVLAEAYCRAFIRAGQSFKVASTALRSSWMAIEADEESRGIALLKPKEDA